MTYLNRDAAPNLSVTLNLLQGLKFKVLTTVNKASALFLRKVINVQNVTITSEASTFNLRKVK
ncbi:hypothetical protein N473_12260 [Pseudoalteromonas luteoviolacea CPMOR-1]|uniref:Uncharacterized protein n=1 Tax=Pseudoalteromonas luteoviolacea CPMOR-1 TaxID=1365248 RepID=A0A167LXE1_9GAMM|nr:hypothetical protein N473_12260 [Pseudoalteromonas luteoviolacea CPMOR-1]